MSELGDRIVAVARTWMNTPFRPQGRLKGRGVDCVGFVSEVATEAGVSVDIPHNYKQHDDGKLMLEILNTVTEQISLEDVEPGDIFALTDDAVREPSIPRHLVFVTELTPKGPRIIHATAGGVKAHRMDAFWVRKIHSVWRIVAT